MTEIKKNTKVLAREDLPVRIEKSILGRLLILLSDISFIILRKLLLLFRKKNGNVVIISLHRLGDSVFAIPAIREILNHYQGFKKIIICFPESGSIFNYVFNTDILTLNKRDFKFGNRIASAGLRSIVKKTNPEIIFDLTGAVTSASLIFNSTASQIIGMNDRIFKNIYSKFTGKRKLPHLIDTYLDVINLVIPVERKPDIYRFSQSENKTNKILIHPFAGWEAKEWNLEKFIRLGKILNNNYKVAFIAKENLLLPEIKLELKKLNIEIIKTRTVDDLIDELKKCSVIISNDSGPVYVASLLGIPTFTIYGPTNPVYSVPFGEHHEYIQKEIYCSPGKDMQYCFTDAGRKGCPSFECMNLLTVDEVLLKLYPFLNRINLRAKVEAINDKNK